MIANNLKRNVIQNGIKMGIVHSNRMQRLKNFAIEKGSVAILTVVKLFSSASDENRMNVYYDFKESITMMKVLRLEIKKRALTSEKVNGQKSIDEMSSEYREAMSRLVGLYLLNCENIVHTGKYASGAASVAIQKVLKKGKYTNKLLGN